MRWIAVCSWGTHRVALPKAETPDAHTFLGLGLWQRGREGDYDPFMVGGHPLSRRTTEDVAANRPRGLGQARAGTDSYLPGADAAQELGRRSGVRQGD